MANVPGIEISIKAFLPHGRELQAQFEALSLVKAAHETGDYSALLAASTIDKVKTEAKTRRIVEAVVAPDPDVEPPLPLPVPEVATKVAEPDGEDIALPEAETEDDDVYA